MVHVFCLDEKCRRIIHLDSHNHWNFKGKVICSKCRAEIELEIRDGEVKSSRKAEGK